MKDTLETIFYYLSFLWAASMTDFFLYVSLYQQFIEEISET